MKSKIKRLVIESGSLQDADDVVRFSKKLPKECKRLLAISFFSPEMCNTATTKLNCKFHLWLNNKKLNVGNNYLELGYNKIDDHKPRVFELNQAIEQNTILSGYIQNLNNEVSSFTVRVHLKTEMND